MSGDRPPAGSAVPPLARLTDRPWYREARAIGRVYGRNRPAVVGAVLLLGFGLIAALAPLVAPADPFLTGQTRESVFNAPSWDHLAGTDALGRDVLSRVFFGARIAWQIVLVATGVAVGLGVPLGLLAGYVGGKLDELVIMRFIDAVMALPGLVLILALTGAVGPSITNTMLIIGVVWSPGYARLTRGVVLQIRQEVYVDAARAIGATPARIMARHLLPNVVAPIHGAGVALGRGHHPRRGGPQLHRRGRAGAHARVGAHGRRGEQDHPHAQRLAARRAGDRDHPARDGVQLRRRRHARRHGPAPAEYPLGRALSSWPAREDGPRPRGEPTMTTTATTRTWEPLSEVRKRLRVKWYRSPIDKPTLWELMERSDRKGLTHALGHLGLIVALGALTAVAFEQGWWGRVRRRAVVSTGP